MRKLLHISHLEHKTNNWVWNKINFLVGPQEPLLATVRRQTLAWFGHLTHHNSLSKTILQGTLDGWCHGWQKKCWKDNIKGWTSLTMVELLTRASCRKVWNRTSAELSLMSTGWPNRSTNYIYLYIYIYTKSVNQSSNKRMCKCKE